MENGLYKNRNLNTQKELFSRLPKQFINIFQKKIQENKSSY
jgi:hypothetical protein